jgi:hypothetical protein
MTDDLSDDADVIHSYSRAQALEDGTLVDLNAGEFEGMARQAGFQFPVACTAAVFAECIAMTPAAERAGNDVKGRAWDVLWMLFVAISIGGARGAKVEYVVNVVRDRREPTPTTLVVVCGPGDNAEPVLTIMFPGED